MLFETERLKICKITIDDAAFMNILVNTPNWLKYIGDRNVRSLEDAQHYLNGGILKHYKDHGYGFYKLILKETGATIGIAGLVNRNELEDVDIGFGLLPEYERKGFGYESSMAIMDYAQKTLKLDRIVAIVQDNNPNSIKLLEKIGLTFEKKVILFEEKEELLLFAKNFN